MNQFIITPYYITSSTGAAIRLLYRHKSTTKHIVYFILNNAFKNNINIGTDKKFFV